jgi:hypothetical protein
MQWPYLIRMVIISRIRTGLNHLRQRYGLHPLITLTIIFSPLLIVYVSSEILSNARRRSVPLKLMTYENQPVQLLTFGLFLLGGILGLLLAKKAINNNERFFVYGFYILFSCALLFCAMEEISWGQQFFKFPTPEAINAINKQNEFTFHNIGVLQRNAEIFRGIFGLGGILGIFLSFQNSFKKICPPRILLLWFITITIFAGLDFYFEFYSIRGGLSRIVFRLAEVMELLVAISSFLFVWLNTKMLTNKWRNS